MGEKMTEKELLYIEDVLSYEQDLEKLCSEFTNDLKEEEIKNFIIYLENKYQNHYSMMSQLLMI